MSCGTTQVEKIPLEELRRNRCTIRDVGIFNVHKKFDKTM